MSTKFAILAFLALAGNTLAAPVEANLEQRADTFLNVPLPVKGKQTFHGDGSPKAGWPTAEKWVSFDKMWDANKPKIGCPSGVPKNSASETDNIKSGIQDIAKKSNVDERYILAVVMQESHGCLRTVATPSPGAVTVNNPGIMQSHNGANHCTKNDKVCSKDKINGMLADGTTGTKEGPGLKQLIDKAQKDLGTKEKSQLYYWAARYYNSGENSIKKGSSLDVDTKAEPGATPSYSSDIANRLVGFTD